MQDFVLRQLLFLEVGFFFSQLRYDVFLLGAVATKRFCSSRDLDNQCIEVKYPQDEKMYYSCTYTCSRDGCNGTSRLNISSISILCFILIQIIRF
jgi:hypothetical protein